MKRRRAPTGVTGSLKHLVIRITACYHLAVPIIILPSLSACDLRCVQPLSQIIPTLSGALNQVKGAPIPENVLGFLFQLLYFLLGLQKNQVHAIAHGVLCPRLRGVCRGTTLEIIIGSVWSTNSLRLGSCNCRLVPR